LSDAYGDAWIRDAVPDIRGWWETDAFQIEDGSMSVGPGAYTIYYFPAPRLALIGIGQPYGFGDSAAWFMGARTEVSGFPARHRSSFESEVPLDADNMEEALAELGGLGDRSPADERIYEWRGYLLLRAGRLAEAQESLLRCLAMENCRGKTRSSALYNIACVYARTGREQDCRTALDEHVKLRPLNKEWTSRDPDFESVRELTWFNSLVSA
jgi:tetratricopeptide (TPR) repeat protein